ncbi:MAG: AsmA family protein [Myxococcota bacterium]
MRLIRRIVFGLLALICLFVGGLALTAYLLDIPALIETYKPQALAAGSGALNRDLDVKTVTPSWFPVLGVRADGLRIGNRALDGRGPSDPGPETFVEVGRVEFGLAIWPALVSLGKDIRIASIRVDEPVVNVVRYPDGTFNFSTLGAETSTPAATPSEGNVFLERLERAGVDLVSLTEGTFRYDDRTPGGVGTFEVRRLGVQAKDIHLGDPVTAELTAALKGALEPNLELSVTTTPLASEPADLAAPGVAEVAVTAKSVPLSIVPFPVQGVALNQARLVTEAVARMNGDQVKVQGSVAVEDLRLTADKGPPGGAFTFSSVLDLSTTTAFQRLDLGSTEVTIGGARARLGGVLGLKPVSWRQFEVLTDPFSVRQAVALLPGERVSVPDGNVRLEVASTGDLDKADSRLAADWQGFEEVQAGLTARGNIMLRATGSGPVSTPSFTGDLDLSGLDVAGSGFAKPAGTTGSANVAGEVRKDGVRLTNLVVELAEATLKGGGFYPLAGRGKVDFGATLAPLDVTAFLGSLQIPAAGVPPGSKLGFDVRYQASPATPAAGRVDLTKIAFTAGGSDLRGSAAVESMSPLSLRLEGRSKRLDLDALLPASSGETSKESSDPNAPLLPESMRGTKVVADLEVETLRYSGLDLTQMDVLLLLEKGQLKVKTTRFGILGGRFTADGTTFDLLSSPPRYALAANLERVKGSELLAQLGVDFGNALEGQLDTQLDIAGSGLDTASLAKSLSGAFYMALNDGKLSGVDLVGATLLPLREALDFAAAATSNTGITQRLATEFDRLAGRFDLENGRLKLKEPLVMKTDQGTFTFDGGGLSIDGGLSLDGTYAVPPSLLRSLTGGKVKPKSSLPVGFRLGCSMTKPCVKDVDVAPAATALARLYAGKALDQGTKLLKERTGIDADRARKAAEQALRDSEAAKKKAEAEALRRAEEAKKKAEAEARRRAEAAKRAAEEKARKAAEAAKKKAEEEAKKRLRGLFGN